MIEIFLQEINFLNYIKSKQSINTVPRLTNFTLF